MFFHYRKSRFCKGHRFLNVVKIIFISDMQNYVPIKLCKTAGSIHLFKIIGTLKAKNIKINKNYLWDTFSSDAKTRNNMVHFGNRNTRNCVNIK